MDNIKVLFKKIGDVTYYSGLLVEFIYTGDVTDGFSGVKGIILTDDSEFVAIRIEDIKKKYSN
jgi:hypothetical protein